MDVSRSRRLTIWGIAILIAALVVWQGITYFKHRGMIKADILVLPKDSQLKIDGANTTPGVVYLKPGAHHLIASRQYFDDDVKDVNTADIDGRYPIYMLPGANSDKAKEWLTQHPDIQAAREAAGGSESERIRQAILKNHPFLANLPVENLHYKIDYSLPDNQKPRLTVTLYAIINGPQDYDRYQTQLKNYRQEALDYLTSHSVKKTDYTIEFIP